MKTSDIIETLKVFFLDILGYFAPGFYAIVVLSATVFPNYFFSSEIIKVDPTWRAFIIIFLSYILGYVIYSLASLSDPIFKIFRFIKIKERNKWKGYLSFNGDIDNELSKHKETQICKTIIMEHWKLESQNVYTQDEINNMNFHTVRNIAMSYSPEYDTKIYTFMFRSDLCQHISSFSILIALAGLLSVLSNKLLGFVSIFKIDANVLIIYILLFVSSIFLHRTKARFYKIAMVLPLSIFLSKYFKFEAKQNA